MRQGEVRLVGADLGRVECRHLEVMKRLRAVDARQEHAAVREAPGPTTPERQWGGRSTLETSDKFARREIRQLVPAAQCHVRRDQSTLRWVRALTQRIN